MCKYTRRRWMFLIFFFFHSTLRAITRVYHLYTDAVFEFPKRLHGSNSFALDDRKPLTKSDGFGADVENDGLKSEVNASCVFGGEGPKKYKGAKTPRVR